MPSFLNRASPACSSKPPEKTRGPATEAGEADVCFGSFDRPSARASSGRGVRPNVPMPQTTVPDNGYIASEQARRAPRDAEDGNAQDNAQMWEDDLFNSGFNNSSADVHFGRFDGSASSAWAEGSASASGYTRLEASAPSKGKGTKYGPASGPGRGARSGGSSSSSSSMGKGGKFKAGPSLPGVSVRSNAPSARSNLPNSWTEAPTLAEKGGCKGTLPPPADDDFAGIRFGCVDWADISQMSGSPVFSGMQRPRGNPVRFGPAPTMEDFGGSIPQWQGPPPSPQQNDAARFQFAPQSPSASPPPAATGVPPAWLPPPQPGAPDRPGNDFLDNPAAMPSFAHGGPAGCHRGAVPPWGPCGPGPGAQPRVGPPGSAAGASSPYDAFAGSAPPPARGPCWGRYHANF